MNNNYETLKQNVEDTNFFGDIDTKCFLDISNDVHQMINVEEENSSLINAQSSFDNFFNNLSKGIRSTSDLINDQLNEDSTSLNLELDKFNIDQQSEIKNTENDSM